MIEVIKNEISDCGKQGKIRGDIDNLSEMVQKQQHNGCNSKEDLNEIEDLVQQLKDEIVWKESIKWYVAIYGFIFTFFLFFFCIYPVFYYFVSQVAKSVILKAAIISKDMIPAGLKASSIIKNKEIFLTAWDLNNSTPRFFSRFSAEYWKGQTFNNDLTLGEMTLASMSSPEYVEPAVIDNDVYISGDNVAKSPALFAYMFTKKRNVDRKMRVISIGAVDEEPVNDELLQYSLVDWCLYLMKSNHDIVSHTMDYMLRSMVQQDEG